MDTEKELQLQRFKIIEPFLRKEKKIKRNRRRNRYFLCYIKKVGKCLQKKWNIRS